MGGVLPKFFACFDLVLVPSSHYTGTTYETEKAIEDECKKNLKKACKTHWLSFDASIQAVWEDYIPVVQTLNTISESDVTAYRLLKR